MFRDAIEAIIARQESFKGKWELLPSKERFIKTAFAYILYHGMMPVCQQDQSEYLKWFVFKDAWKPIRATRAKIAEILGVLAEAARSQAGNPTAVGASPPAPATAPTAPAPAPACYYAPPK